MSEKMIELSVITPKGVKVKNEVYSVIFRCIDGDMGVLPGHEPISVVMGDGVLRAKAEDGNMLIMAIFGGIAIVENDAVKIMTTEVELPEDIDLEKTEKQKLELEEIKDEEMSKERVKKLRKASVRLEVLSTLNKKEG